MVPADLDHELVDRVAPVALEDVDGHDVATDGPDPLATRPSAPGRSGSAIRTT